MPTAQIVVPAYPRSLFFLDLVKGQAGPTYTIPSGKSPDLNRNLIDAIEIVAHRAQHSDPVE
jgi:hypothetical protein